MSWLFNESVSTYVTFGAAEFPDGDWTIGGWMKSAGNAGTGYQYFLSWGTVDATPDFNLYYIEASAPTSANQIKAVALDSGGWGQNSSLEWISEHTTKPGANTNWRHVIIMRRSDLVVIYIDGVSGTTRDGEPGLISLASDMFFGVRSDLNVDRCFGGRMAEWSFWTRALEDWEIKALAGADGFVRTKPSELPNTTGRGWYLPMRNSFTEEWGALPVTNHGSSTDSEHPIEESRYYPSFDEDCLAWWRNESGALGIDASGHGHNRLTTNVTAETTDFMEGAGSSEFAGSGSTSGLWTGHMTDDYPFKNGFTNRVFSATFWIKLSALQGGGTYSYAYVSWNSIWILVYNDGSGTRIAFVNWYGGGNYEIDQHDSVLSVDTWYHVAVTFDASLNWRIRIWDDTAQEILGTDKTGTKAGLTDLNSGDANVGHDVSGLLDDYLIFKRALSVEDIDKIRDQTFGAGAVPQNIQITIDDGVGITDAEVKALQAMRTISDTLGIFDSFSSVSEVIRVFSETTGLSDSVAKVFNADRTIADSIGLTDQVIRLMVISRVITDNMGLSDGVALDRLITIAESMGMQDQMGRLVDFARVEMDGIGMSDFVSKVSEMLRVVDDGVTINDQAQVTLSDVFRAVWAFIMLKKGQ